MCGFGFGLLLVWVVVEEERSWVSVFFSIFWGTQMEFFVRILVGSGFVMHVIVGLLWNAITVMIRDPQVSCIFWGRKQKVGILVAEEEKAWVSIFSCIFLVPKWRFLFWF
ncbi:hypothetical protein RchiOBHm_Chr3g0449431 [Rosa chinensis]|uniref:Transmembrane protein n=1 Tax=Rosa chinensis TaxID=74649 RepID=A0A2P6R5L0_ROSCH|nr:hypothetical protein RchiOBHm_Chr3g0449431 [Rosa chinensis]